MKINNTKCLCDYGCGKEAEYCFKNGKLCCSKNFRSCEKMKSKKLGQRRSKEAKNKMRKPKSEDHKQKIKIALLGKKKSQEHKQKLGKSKLGKQLSKDHKQKLRKPKHSEEWKQKLRENMLNGKSEYLNSFPRNQEKMERLRKYQKEKLLNGYSSYMLSKIKNPSKPQKKLFEIVKDLYPSAILNYPIPSLNYNVDIVILEYHIIIEYDGMRYHLDKEKDIKRQKEIENYGWKFIRYTGTMTKDIVPTKTIVENYILKIIKEKI